MTLRAFAVPVLMLASFAVLSVPSASQEPDPVVFGMLSHNTGCVIFAEGHKTSGRLYGIAVTTKTVGKLTTLETQHTTFAEKEVVETQDNLDRLLRLAQTDNIKFVKIPEKHSPDLLTKARALCAANGA